MHAHDAPVTGARSSTTTRIGSSVLRPAARRCSTDRVTYSLIASMLANQMGASTRRMSTPGNDCASGYILMELWGVGGSGEEAGVGRGGGGGGWFGGGWAVVSGDGDGGVGVGGGGAGGAVVRNGGRKRWGTDGGHCGLREVLLVPTRVPPHTHPYPPPTHPSPPPPTPTTHSPVHVGAGQAAKGANPRPRRFIDYQQQRDAYRHADADLHALKQVGGARRRWAEQVGGSGSCDVAAAGSGRVRRRRRLTKTSVKMQAAIQTSQSSLLIFQRYRNSRLRGAQSNTARHGTAQKPPIRQPSNQAQPNQPPTPPSRQACRPSRHSALPLPDTHTHAVRRTSRAAARRPR